MQFKPPIQQSPSNNQLLRLSPLSRSLLIPIINKQIPPKKAHFQNGYATQKFFNRYARTQYILAGSLIVSLAMIIIYFELSIDNDPLTQSVLYLSSVFQFFCIFVLVINHITFNDYKMHQKHHFQTKKYSELIFYALFLLVKPYPFLEQYSISFENQLIFQTHQINHLLCLVSFLQVFLVIPCFFVRSKYQSLRSQRISDMYGSRASYVYALKCWFKENSVFEILMVFFCWFGFCVFGIRISEYQTNHSLQSFQNSVWLTFITMSTVGFGDLTPKSNVGYTISTITMYSGVMVMSIVVMILRESFSLSSSNFIFLYEGQKRTLKILRTLQQKSQLKILASKFIRSALWRIWKNKQNRHFGTFFSPDMEQRNARQQFRLLRRISQKNNFQNNLKDQFQHNFAKIYGYLDSLEQNQSRIINALQNLR